MSDWAVTGASAAVRRQRKSLRSGARLFTLQQATRVLSKDKSGTSTAGSVRQRCLAMLSSCPEPWGGSEELWGGAALKLADSGHRIWVVRNTVDPEHSKIRALKEVCAVDEYYAQYAVPNVIAYLRNFIPRRWAKPLPDMAAQWLSRSLKKLRPDLVVISQGENFDGLHFVEIARECGLPYVLVCQKVSDENWPADHVREAMRCAYLNAKYVYFVSQHNREITELQIGTRLTNAEVVRNPFLTPVDAPLAWPKTPSGRFRLACLARLFILEKGQDILLRVLAQEKWKARPVDVTFYGTGMHADGLKELAAMLDVRNVHFAGLVSDIVGIWQTHHALVLPSRREGLPLSLVESMLCGRPSIVTDVGGNTEVVEDNQTGFIAKAPNVMAFDEALERAWQRRHEWELIGKAASISIRKRVPRDPCAEFAGKLLGLIG